VRGRCPFALVRWEATSDNAEKRYCAALFSTIGFPSRSKIIEMALRFV